ncbi:MAG: hypothetical protein HY795_08605 [Desulfovibrio sp.]|nr:hypothetical protein [Desulfovibrio sp.]MBI4960216.1 hypothetical protein [Desulfovibrio sp.]
MKAAVLTAVLLLSTAFVCQAYDAPLELGGIRLGASIQEYPGKIATKESDTDLNRQYLSTMALMPVPGFRSGYVTSGTCDSPGRIARIKMNYDDDSMAFYEKLLTALKSRYGEPKQWRGNPFGNLRIWKWSLKDQNLGDISIILQRYSGEDDSFTKGNSIRIAATGLLEKEHECYRRKHPREKVVTPAPATKELGIEHFLPR